MMRLPENLNELRGYLQYKVDHPRTKLPRLTMKRLAAIMEDSGWSISWSDSYYKVNTRKTGRLYVSTPREIPFTKFSASKKGKEISRGRQDQPVLDIAHSFVTYEDFMF